MYYGNDYFLVNSASMHSFLHIAIVKSAFLSDKEENVEQKSISKNVTLTSSRAIEVNLSVMRRLTLILSLKCCTDFELNH